MSLIRTLSGHRALSGNEIVRSRDKVADNGQWRTVRPHEIGWLWYSPHLISNRFIRKVRGPMGARTLAPRP